MWSAVVFSFIGGERRVCKLGWGDVVDTRFALPVYAVVDGSYRIVRVVGAGGFGITYEAEDINLGTKIALKEYYPFDFGDRDGRTAVRPKSDRHRQAFEWGRTSFLREARTLARFDHASIVRVTRVFEANSTAYMVMRLEQGRSYEAWLKDLGRPPTQEELDRITNSLLDALDGSYPVFFPQVVDNESDCPVKVQFVPM
jgi:serine/threonine protein kinase